MAWFKMHQELARHPKLKRFARGLGISEPTAIGHLFLLWAWAMDYAQDGSLARFSEDDIAFAMQWDGGPGAMIDALLSCGGKMQDGFLERDDNGALILHNWEEYCGWRFHQRIKGAERIRRHREKGKCNADVTRYTSVSNAFVTRGEERRGEEKRGDTPPYSPPPAGGRREDEPPANVSTAQATEQPTQPLSAEKPQQSGGARPNTDGKEAESPSTGAFGAFWALYPRKVQKQTALKAWRALIKHAADADVVNATAAYTAATRRRGTPPDKIMHPATFLREDRWRDWLPPDGASYREALGGRHESSRPAGEHAPLSYADAVERFRGAGAATVDLSPCDWREPPEKGTAMEVAK